MAKKKEEKTENKPKKAEKKASHKAEKAKEKKDAHKGEKAKEKHAEKKPGHKHEEGEKHKGKKHAQKDEEKPAKKGEEEKPKKAGKAKEKPAKEKKPGVPSWVELKPEEAVEAIVNLANAGHTSSEIGMLLRDQYGVPNIKKLCGKSIDSILEEHKLLPEIPSDLMSLIKKSVKLRSHMEKNKKDFSAKRGLQLTVSKIRNLVRYYKRKGKLPLDWRYSEEKAALLVK
ncbi:MAG: 30S ribosomal protein S15 [Candidatus Diapherotrites archaeon]|uniref:Small ribosomal subunit protein uS15 n=1 Tax=Candidatus Iainarchaeum sp. TaxID=3101447 RepID=A0A938YNW1_9ARCH|nr:30S ribosomal protein S15 [Candidatus Diapherotrites archaeon]